MCLICFPFYFLFWKTNGQNKITTYQLCSTILRGRWRASVQRWWRTLLSLVAYGYQVPPEFYASCSSILPIFSFFFNKSKDLETLGWKGEKP